MVETKNRIHVSPYAIECQNMLFGKEVRFNPRTLENNGFTPEKMEDLKRGIQRDGLNHALLVTYDQKKKKYKLIAGERRLRCILGLLEEDKICLERIKSGEKDVERVFCFDPEDGTRKPALEVYSKVECKLTECEDEQDALRKAIQENTLHEGLSEFELLLQCERMEQHGISRSEQSQIMGMSEAWISQSHSLLATHPRILQYMKEGVLARTAALTFLNVPPDKVEDTLDRAIHLTYRAAEEKEKEIQSLLDQSALEIEASEATLKVSAFTGDHSSAKQARKSMARASRNYAEHERKLKEVKAGKEKTKVTAETVATAAREVEAGDKIRRPQSAKQTRLIYKEITDLLARSAGNTIVNPATGAEFKRREIEIVNGVLGWLLSENKLNHPLEVLSAKEKSR